MATGPAWNLDNPLKPWALFDSSPTTELVIPFEIEDWLAEMGTTYSAHEVIADAPLASPNHPLVDGVIMVRITLADAAEFTVGRKYPFTVRLTGANGPDGGGPQTDDRTLYLKLQPR